jgi:hypothetical protein
MSSPGFHIVVLPFVPREGILLLLSSLFVLPLPLLLDIKTFRSKIACQALKPLNSLKRKPIELAF